MWFTMQPCWRRNSHLNVSPALSGITYNITHTTRQNCGWKIATLMCFSKIGECGTSQNCNVQNDDKLCDFGRCSNLTKPDHSQAAILHCHPWLHRRWTFACACPHRWPSDLASPATGSPQSEQTGGSVWVKLGDRKRFRWCCNWPKSVAWAI